jgi:hypothetical protein
MLSRLYINQMRNKELALRRLETIQGRLKQLEFIINRGSSEERVNSLRELNELITDLQSIIEREN